MMLKKKIIIFLILLTQITYSQWQELNTGISLTLFSISAIDENLVWACASGPNIIRTTDGGTTWVNVGTNVPPPNGVETTIFAFDANTAIFASYAGSPTTAYVYKTTNSGANWSLVLTQAPGFITAVNFKNSTQGFMVGWPEGGRWSLWRSTNAGNNWDSTGLYIPEVNQSYWSFENGMFYSGSNIWFGSRGRGIYHSTNDGASWQLQNLTSGGFPYPSAIYFETPSLGYSSAQLNVVKTTNSGTNWGALPGSTGTEVLRGVVSYGSQIWYVREITPDIFYSSNGGSNWLVQHSSPSGTGYRYITKSRNANVLWACTIAGEMAKYTLPLSVHNLSSEIPLNFKLEQNYPNPFNPETTFRFHVHNYSAVSLIIYDAIGREIQKLVNENLKPGIYEIKWNASDIPSGTYFYKMKAGKYSQTKKMILIK